MSPKFCISILHMFLCASISYGQAVVQSLPTEVEDDWSQPGFWTSSSGRPVTDSWEFAGSEICLAKPRGGSGNLLSRPLPPNFQLSWKWKIDEGTNSGVKYRVRKFGNRLLGVEYQIIDETKSKTAIGSTASIYDLVPPLDEKVVKPVGQWNDATVKADGCRLEHYLNGKLVASVNTVGPSWESTIAKSKFWNAEGFGRPIEGDRIMLTDHGGKVWYKDFQFTAIDKPSQIESPKRHAPFFGNGMRNSWADQNSIVLWTRTTSRPELNADGQKFISLTRQEAFALSKQSDEQEIHAAQIPNGNSLEEMFGACPGAPGEVKLTYFPKLNRNKSESTKWITTNAKSDFTAQWKLDGLLPGKEYAAIIEARPVGGTETTAVIRGTFQTVPPKDKAAGIDFCVTTCHDFIRTDDGLRGHKIYPTMTKMDPDFVVHAGDIEYYDKPDPWAMTVPLMRFKWGRLFALPSNRIFYSNTTTYFIKDDHDTLKNDCWTGQTYGSVSFEQGVRLFNEEQFPSHPTRYKTVSWGKDLQVWILEGRDFRSPNNMPDGPEKSILGAEQKAWLLKTLDESNASFKLIFSPTPIVGPDRKNKKDNHANEIFEHEGIELRAAFGKHENLIVFCGDRHWQYASVDPETKLWEFGCGPGSEKHQLGWKKGDERPQHRFLRVAGGFLSGKLKPGKNPTLTIRHHKVDGEKVSEFKFPKAWQETE